MEIEISAEVEKIYQFAELRAQELDRRFVMPEHILYGVCCEPSAVTLLKRLHVRSRDVVYELNRGVQIGGDYGVEKTTTFLWSPRSQIIRQRAHHEALSRQMHTLRVEHLLISGIKSESVFSRTLENFDVTIERINELISSASRRR